MTRSRAGNRTAGWLTLAALAGCGGGERTAPEPPELAIAKPETQSGDQQVGVAGAPLAAVLRVVVTRDSMPAAESPSCGKPRKGPSSRSRLQRTLKA